MPADLPASTGGPVGRERRDRGVGHPPAAAPAPEPPDAPRLREVVAEHLFLEGPLLPIFHAVQAEFGHVPRWSLPIIAGALNLSRAEVHGVMTFYHDFREAPAGRHVLKLCRAEACQSVGAEALAARVRRMTGLDWHETSADGRLTLEPVFCLGLCACGPAAMLDGEVLGRVDEALLAERLEEAP